MKKKDINIVFGNMKKTPRKTKKRVKSVKKLVTLKSRIGDER